MAERPILMSGPMVRAILNGTKRVTRRPMNPQPPDWCTEFGFTCFTPEGHISGRGNYGDEGPAEKFFKLRYAPGDVAWVKESWRTVADRDHIKPRDLPQDPVIEYLADDYRILDGKNRPSIFMCRWMSRIDLLILSARPERLGDITEEDAIKEGIMRQMMPNIEGNHFHWGDPQQDRYPTAVLAYAALWDAIHGAGAWQRDCQRWVWRYEFEGPT